MTLPSGHAQSATLANPNCIHATTPFVYKRPVKFSIAKAKSLTSILAFEFLNGYRRLNVCTVSEIREYIQTHEILTGQKLPTSVAVWRYLRGFFSFTALFQNECVFPVNLIASARNNKVLRPLSTSSPRGPFVVRYWSPYPCRWIKGSRPLGTSVGPCKICKGDSVVITGAVIYDELCLMRIRFQSDGWVWAKSILS